MTDVQATYRLEFDREQEIYFTEESTQPFFQEMANLNIFHTVREEWPLLLAMYSEIQEEQAPWAVCLNMSENKLHIRILRGQDFVDFISDVPPEMLFSIYESLSLYNMLFVNVFTETEDEEIDLVLRTKISVERIFYMEKPTTPVEVRWWLSRN